MRKARRLCSLYLTRTNATHWNPTSPDRVSATSREPVAASAESPAGADRANLASSWGSPAHSPAQPVDRRIDTRNKRPSANSDRASLLGSVLQITRKMYLDMARAFAAL